MDRSGGNGEEAVMKGSRCALLPFREEFAEDLARAANNPNVARNLLDVFPHPYTLQDAQQWIAFCRHHDNGRRFCICVPTIPDSERSDERPSAWQAVGGIEAKEADLSNFKHSVELGYWLSESYWGQRIMTEAVTMFVSYVFSDAFASRWNQGQPIVRVWASVFERNSASARVLVKAGFELEGKLKKAYIKNGTYVDALLYAFVRDPPLSVDRGVELSS